MNKEIFEKLKELEIEYKQIEHPAAFTMEEIEENDYNLNIPRYVDTFEPEPEVDLQEVANDIRKVQTEIKDIDKELKPFFDELGLDFPFGDN